MAGGAHRILMTSQCYRRRGTDQEEDSGYMEEAKGLAYPVNASRSIHKAFPAYMRMLYGMDLYGI